MAEMGTQRRGGGGGTEGGFGGGGDGRWEMEEVPEGVTLEGVGVRVETGGMREVGDSWGGDGRWAFGGVGLRKGLRGGGD